MGILYSHKCILCGADFPVTTSRTLQLCPDCAVAVRREYRCTEPERTVRSLRCITAAQYAMP